MPDVELRKLELQEELKKLEMQKEQELRELVLQEKERDRQEREKERELRLEKQRLDHELELKKLELEDKFGSSHAKTSWSNNFDVTKPKHVRLVLPFQEVEVISILYILRKYQIILNYPNIIGPYHVVAERYNREGSRNLYSVIIATSLILRFCQTAYS